MYELMKHMCYRTDVYDEIEQRKLSSKRIFVDIYKKTSDDADRIDNTGYNEEGTGV